jgi:hypothetical protein
MYRENHSWSEVIVIFIIAIALLFIISSCQDDSNSEKINNKVHSIHGEVLDIESKSMLSDTPFTLYTKEMRVYKFTYMLDGEEKVGWYRSRAFGEDWILDYQKD